jgi:hypothetical protein
MTVCLGDVPDATVEMVAEMWNRRASETPLQTSDAIRSLIPPQEK